jgi:hypothetical protein
MAIKPISVALFWGMTRNLISQIRAKILSNQTRFVFAGLSAVFREVAMNGDPTRDWSSFS